MSSEPLITRCEVVITRGGARAMLDHETGEVMHPVVGPLIEATRLYVTPSNLAARLQEMRDADGPLVLLDVGLGAGSNASAAWQVSEAIATPARRLEIVSFDRTLTPFELALQAENAAAFGLSEQANEAGRALLAHGRYETARTTWRLHVGELPDVLALEPSESADIVFWDPFSPRANPALWTATAFTKVRRLCRRGATLFTYSGATATRSALLLAGFAVGFGAVTGDNKRATIAAVDWGDLTEPLDARWLARLQRSSAAFPSDAPQDAFERIAQMPQFRGP